MLIDSVDTCRTVTTTGPDGPQSNNICRGAPAAGMWTGSGCSTNDNCVSGFCTDNTCQETPITPSARARHRFKRALVDTHEKIAKAMAHAFSKGKTATLGCPNGMTACLIGTSSGSSLGYEVTISSRIIVRAYMLTVHRHAVYSRVLRWLYAIE